MVFATVTGCFLLTGFIPAQTAQAPVGQHVLKEITGDHYTYTPSPVTTSNDQQQPVVHPSGQTDASKKHASRPADHSSQSSDLPVVATKPENKPSATAPTYEQPNTNANHTNEATSTNDRQQPAYEPKPSPASEPSSSDQPSRKPRRDDSGQPSQTEPSNPPDSESPPPQEKPPQPPDDQPGDDGQGNDDDNRDNGLVEGILNPLLDTVNKTLP